jgi:hypothetical protein
MRAERLSVVEPIHALAVRRAGRKLRLMVQDDAGKRHTICFRFASPAMAELHAERVVGWARFATPLAYVSGARESALVELDALFARATG